MSAAITGAAARLANVYAAPGTGGKGRAGRQGGHSGPHPSSAEGQSPALGDPGEEWPGEAEDLLRRWPWALAKTESRFGGALPCFSDQRTCGHRFRTQAAILEARGLDGNGAQPPSLKGPVPKVLPPELHRPGLSAAPGPSPAGLLPRAGPQPPLRAPAGPLCRWPPALSLRGALWGVRPAVAGLLGGHTNPSRCFPARLRRSQDPAQAAPEAEDADGEESPAPPTCRPLCPSAGSS